MAVFRPAAPFGDLRGSIGQTTYGRNSAGLFARARTAPDDSAPSAEQLELRQHMRDTAAAWLTLTLAQRLSWRALAAATSMPNALGDAYTPTAWQLYTRLNMLALFMGYAVTNNTPTQAIAPSSVFTYDYLAGTGIRLLSVGQRTWTGSVLFQGSWPLTLNRYWCKGPWRTGWDLVKEEAWIAGLPHTLLSAAALTANKSYFNRSRILDSTTGAISFAQIARVTTT